VDISNFLINIKILVVGTEIAVHQSWSTMVNSGVEPMMKSAIASIPLLVISAGVYASEVQVPLGGTAPQLGGTLSMPALAMIAAVGLIAGIRYLRNKRS
jgi:hypothetical protein